MKILSVLVFLFAVITLRAETVQVVETDRQGETRVIGSTTTTTTKLPDGGEKTEASISRRNSTGKLVLDATVSSTIATGRDGVTTTTQTERRMDVNGKLQPAWQVTERATKVSATETRAERTIESYDHVNARFGVSGRERATARAQGATTTTETTIEDRTSTGWRETGRLHVTETKASDGSIQREIIESSRSTHDRASGKTGLGDELMPRMKYVEHEVVQADGTRTIQRQTFRRDVNGDWQPTSFSTENGQPSHRW